MLGEVDKDIYLLQEEQKDLRKFPLEKISTMLFCYIVMLMISFLKGSQHFKSIINIKE